MELNLSNKQKTILEGIIRSCAFLVVMRELAPFVFEYISGAVMWVLVNCFAKIDAFLNPVTTTEEWGIDLFGLFVFGVIYCVFNTYILAKLCGILKYFSQFKFWKSFLFLLVISVGYYYFAYLNLHTFKLNYEADTAGGMGISVTIIISYIVYLFFNFLTKKFPTPFNQIGYFFSNEFYKDLYKRVIKKKRKD